MENYGSLPVGKRTRNMEAEMYRKCHEEIKRKRNLQGNSKLTSEGTCSKKVNLGKKGKNVLGSNSQDGALCGGGKKNLAVKVKRKKTKVDDDMKCSGGIDKVGLRRRSNALTHGKRKRFSGPSSGRKKSSFLNSTERRSRGVIGNGGGTRGSWSHSWLQDDDSENDSVYEGEREEGEQDDDSESDFVFEGDREAGGQDDDSENDFVYEGERNVGDRDIEKREIILIGDDEDGDREREGGDGVNRKQSSGRASSVGEGDVERREFIDIGDGVNANDENVEELNVEEDEEKGENCSTDDDDDDDMEEDNDYVVNDNEKGNSDDDDEVDDVVVYECSDVDMDAPESPLSFKDGCCKDRGAQNSANSDVIGQDFDVKEQDDDVEECQILENEPVDPVDISKPNFVKSNLEDGKCQVKDDTVRSSFQGESDGAGKKKVKHGTTGNPQKGNRHCDSVKDHEVEEILVASILKDGNENLPFEEITKSPSKPTLSLKFTFGIEESPSHHKEPEEDEEILKLWDEMTLSLSQNDVNGNQKEENKPETCNDAGETTCCSKGNHQFVLDEEIGVVCECCSYVQLEIRYYAAPMSENLFGRSERRAYAKMPNNTSNDIDCRDLEFTSQSGADPTVDFNGTVWSIIPGIRWGMHPHQIDGFEFLWKNIAGSIRLDDIKGHTSSSRGSGCVISHAPGTGKSRLTIAFLETYTKLYPSSKPIIIAPASMLQTWEAEFLKWKVEVPFHNLNNDKLTGNVNKEALKWLKPGGQSVRSIRLIKLYLWKKGSGVLALSYRLFEELSAGGDRKKGRPRRREDHKVWKALLELPGLLILDEGHTPRNSNSLIWKALSKMHTGKKIILSGTPFQNNFEELFNILCLVRPEFADRFLSGSYTGLHCSRKSDAREYWDSVTSAIGKSANQSMESRRVDQVRQMIAPFVHVHKGNILQEKLPGLRDTVIILKPTGLQRILLDRIVENMTHQNFEMEHAVSVASVHPYLLCTKSHKPSGLNLDRSKLESLKLDPDAGVKTKFLMELVQLSTLVEEKVLVFSQFVEPLKLISKHLQDRFSWSEGREILLMHGRCRQDQRQAMLRDFNEPHSLSEVMLASTKACSEGISLVGASRVVLLDVVWNPSVGKQAISRAYRLGQEKVVHIYHLLASALEEVKYRRQAEKERWSELVIYSADEADGSTQLSCTLTDDKKDKLLEQMVEGDKLKNIFKKIICQPKDGNLVEAFSYE